MRNGDIAISGGPKEYEVIIYTANKHFIPNQREAEYVYRSSLSTKG